MVVFVFTERTVNLTSDELTATAVLLTPSFPQGTGLANRSVFQERRVHGWCKIAANSTQFQNELNISLITTG
jgi:hypothetical protein